MPEPLTMTEKEWEHLNASQRVWVLYRSVQSLNDQVEVLRSKVPWSKTLSFLGGFFGGLAGLLSLTAFK